MDVLLQGLVAFSSQGDRIALTQIEQLYDNRYVKLGYYDTQADNLTWLEREQWVGKFVYRVSIYPVRTSYTGYPFIQCELVSL